MGDLATLPLTKPNDTSSLPPPLFPPPSPPSKMSIMTNTWIPILCYITSLPLLCYGIWLLFTKDYECQDYLHMPHLREIIGVGLIVAFSISCFVTHYGAKVVLPGALVLAVAILIMLTFGILLIGNYSMESRSVPASPLWIKNRIDNSETWTNVKSCIYETSTCSDLAYNTIKLSMDDFSNKHLSDIESGCCKPPSLCGMEYVNATYWKRPENQDRSANNATSPSPPTLISNPTSSAAAASYSTNTSAINPNTYGDCQAWSNEVTQLCFDCQSCKEGFISTVHSYWWNRGIFMIVLSSFLILVHTPRFILAMVQRNKSFRN